MKETRSCKNYSIKGNIGERERKWDLDWKLQKQCLGLDALSLGDHYAGPAWAWAQASRFTTLD